jgi:hypothetical protein
MQNGSQGSMQDGMQDSVQDNTNLPYPADIFGCNPQQVGCL